MSRCFPFPPPGYAKKSRTDDVEDLPKKEKNREKKHKKEKRDNEKRESKERREKDRSEGKQKEKKDRKERHRDKKKDREKDRDKDKDKDKNATSDEKKLAGQSQGHNGETFSQKEDWDKNRDSVSDEKRLSGQFVGYNGERLSQNSNLSEETKDSKFVQELDKRIRDENKGTRNQLVEKFTGTDRKKDEGTVRLVAKDIGTGAEGKEKNKDKRIDNRKIDGRGIEASIRGNSMVQRGIEANFRGNSMVQNLAGVVQSKVEGVPRPVEKHIERKMEGKEKTKEKESDDKRGDKRKDKDRDKKSQGKDKDRNKEKKKEEKAKEKNEHKNSEQDKIKESNNNDPIGTHNMKTSDLPKDSNKSAASEGNLRKRKDYETNGFLHANDVRPNKLPRPTSSHPLTENGRILEPCQTPIIFTSDRQGAASTIKVHNKERRVNGVIEAPPISISSTKPSSATAPADQIAEASLKPPHPDSKDLSKIFSVPKMDEWSDCDDQEWLFSCDETQSKRPEVGFSTIDETPQVWAEALRIESADVCALPYVIPY
ncbi:hypothetical protein L1049_017569 [Liquidambar formosana]|uniref:Myb-like protein X n=1 Tax=Liquidambar formosana TaxID=63359 RepID=A0AAP0S7N1_LIQFO